MLGKKAKNVTASTAIGSLTGLAGALLLRKLTAPKKGAGLGSYALWGSVGAGLGGLTGYGLATVNTDERSPEQKQQQVEDLVAERDDLQKSLEDPDKTNPGWLRAWLFTMLGAGSNLATKPWKFIFDGETNRGKLITDLKLSRESAFESMRGAKESILKRLGAADDALRAQVKAAFSYDKPRQLDALDFKGKKVSKSIDKFNDAVEALRTSKTKLRKLRGPWYMKSIGRKGLGLIIPAVTTGAGYLLDWPTQKDWWNSDKDGNVIWNTNYVNTDEGKRKLDDLNQQLEQLGPKPTK